MVGYSGRGLHRSRFFRAFDRMIRAPRFPCFARCAALIAALAGLLLPAAAAAQFEQGLLWRLERQGVAPSYVFGTIHLDDRRVTALPDEVRRQFDAARSFTMEVALDSPNMMQLAARMVYADGRTLEDAIGAELYGRLVPLMEQSGVPEPTLRLFRPWAAMVLLVVPRQSAADVLDFKLYRAAREQAKPVFQLESAADQANAFESMPEAGQVAMLRHAVDTHGRIAEMTERLVAAYLRRDLAEMWRMSEESGGAARELQPVDELFTRKLLFERNQRMAERMLPQLARGGAFVAVGALHLYGERSVLRLLQQQGYRVSRMY